MDLCDSAFIRALQVGFSLCVGLGQVQQTGYVDKAYHLLYTLVGIERQPGVANASIRSMGP